MRKFFLFLLLVLTLCACATAEADTFTFDSFSAKCQVDSGKYTILTPENLEAQRAFLEKLGTTPEAALADFEARGVVLQAWTASLDACLEITAVQDEFAQQYYDINQVSADERATYRLGHSSDKNGYWRSLGYDYSSAQWKNTTDTGRFLQLQYTRTVGGETYRGYARKTIRNGYHIHVDYQVFGRGLKSSDNKALDAVMNTWEFLEVWPRPATSVSKLIFSAEPPAESSTGKFTISGSGAPGLQLTFVGMRMTSTDAYQFETTIGKNGKFSVNVVLPAEGYWIVTYTVVNADVVVEEGAFNPTQFQKNLLTVSLNTELPTVLTGNELVISGVTMKQTKVQCIVDGRESKQITTNNTGAFSFTIDTSEEGVYTITLVFEKKGYNARRFRSDATRTYTEEDRRQIVRDQAVKPAYKTLTDKLSGYTGRYMVYTLYIERVDQTSTGYVTFAGMKRTKSGVIQENVVIRSSEAPDFAAGDAVHMYLKCIGSYEVTDDSGTASYPYFDLQFVE